MNKTILVPIDYSDVTDALLEEARRLALAFDATLHLVHAALAEPAFYSPYEVGMGTAYLREDKPEIMRTAASHLAATAEACRADLPVVTTALLDGHPARGIMEEARRVRPMMIVLGSHGHGALYHLLAGSVCQYVIKHAECPITIVPSRAGALKVEVEEAHTATTA
ncbi:MAG: universal stress protein [Phycisphaerales bacterium]|jgi:nucleotide-binding universal stress UspA family protein|nr:universal stress protein [Phycisphaerales bacterium]